MADSSNVIATSSFFPVPGSWPWRIALVFILTAVADWLLFREAIGVSLTLFVLAVTAGVLLANRIDANRRELLLYGGILVAAILPSVEDFNVMSALIAALGIGCFALGTTAALRGSLPEKAAAVGWFLLSGPLQFFRDLPPVRQWASERGAPVSANTAKGWIVPLALGSIFVTLFAAANPLIANWLTQWNVEQSVSGIDIWRLMFWSAAFTIVWAFVCVRGHIRLPGFDRTDAAVPAHDAAAPDTPPVPTANPIFNDATIVRSLVLFNLLFAVQTVLDIGYLWAGVALPDGMTYAAYAHRGAYPLIATALLAAAFVIIAMRPGSDAERSPKMRALVFLWVGQNVLLVVSAMLRLNLYVET